MTRKRPKCRHPFFDRFIATRDIHTHDGQTRMTYEFCGVCGAWVSLGPSDETDPRVALEIRAAELAAAWKPIGGVRRLISKAESIGWGGWPHRTPQTNVEDAGFLAAQIRNHERDLGDVNWAGHHMADHPLDARAIADHDSATEREGSE